MKTVTATLRAARAQWDLAPRFGLGPSRSSLKSVNFPKSSRDVIPSSASVAYYSSRRKGSEEKVGEDDDHESSVVDSLKEALSVALFRIITNTLPPSKSWAYENLVKTHAESPVSNIDLVEDVVREMRDAKVSPTLETYNTAIRSVANRGVLTKLMQFRDLMEEDGVAPNMTTYAFVLKAILGLKYSPRHTQLFLLKNIYDEILERGVEMDEVVACDLLNGFSIHLHEPLTLSIFDFIKSRGFVPDIKHYDPMVRLYSRLFKAEQLNAIISEIKSHNLAFTANTYRYLIDYHVRWNHVEEVKRLFSEAERTLGPSETNSRLLSAVLRFFIKRGHHNEVVFLISDMISRGAEIPVDVYMQLYGLNCRGVKLDLRFHRSFKYLVKHLNSRESPASIMDALLDMEPSPDINIFPILLRQFAIDKDLYNAKILLKYLIDLGKVNMKAFLNEDSLRALNLLFYNEMLKNINDGNKIDELLYDKLRHGLPMCDLDYSILITHYESTQDPKKIWKLIDKMQEDGYHVSRQLFVALTYLYTKNLDHANFRKVLRIAERVGYARATILNLTLQRINREKEDASTK